MIVEDVSLVGAGGGDDNGVTYIPVLIVWVKVQKGLRESHNSSSNKRA